MTGSKGGVSVLMKKENPSLLMHDLLFAQVRLPLNVVTLKNYHQGPVSQKTR